MPTLAILFSRGGLGDVGRHAVKAALEQNERTTIKIFSQHPELLEEKRWNCGCVVDHRFTVEERKRFEVIPVESYENNDEFFAIHFQAVDAVLSCLGNRQMFIGDRVGTAGSQAVVKAMKKNNIQRVVAMSSVGILDDWPACEWHFGGKIISLLFQTVSRQEFRDLTGVEEAYRASDLDYLLIRPCGLGEDVVPSGTWALQKEKYKDTVGINMAKLDCARFMVREALNPTRHCDAVVIGAKEEEETWLG